MGSRCCHESPEKSVDVDILSEEPPEKTVDVDILSEPAGDSPIQVLTLEDTAKGIHESGESPKILEDSSLEQSQEQSPLLLSGDGVEESCEIKTSDVFDVYTSVSLVTEAKAVDDPSSPSKSRDASIYSPSDAPLLFSAIRNARKSCFCCSSKGEEKILKSASSLRVSTKASQSGLTHCQVKYDMWVMPVMKLLDLEKMEAHQVLITKGLILRWRPAMQGRIIFVSHQWLGFKEPDPDSVHLRALQRVLNRLIHGEIEEVKIDFRKKFAEKGFSVTKEEWMASLPHMYVWLDYFSMPQVSVPVPKEILTTRSQQKIPRALAGSLSVSYAIALAEKGGRSPGPTELPLQRSSIRMKPSASGVSGSSLQMSTESSDHRYAHDEVAKDLQDAVSSIPAYVELSSLLLVLAPTCRHHETAHVADYTTWRHRGWCRMEMSAALFACHFLPMMLVNGSESTPLFITSIDAMRLLPGEGRFSCCAMDHEFAGVKIPCDKQRVLPVMETIISAKVEDLAQRGKHLSKSMVASLRNHYLRGLPGNDDNIPTSVAALKELVSFKLDSDLRIPPAKQNLVLLQIAVQFGSAELVGELLDSKVDANARGISIEMFGIPPIPILATAMAFSTDFGVVEELLRKKSDPYVKMKKAHTMINGANVLQVALLWGNERNARSWLDHFPGWDVNSGKLGVLGFSHLQAAAIAVSTTSNLVEMVLAARADATMLNDAGGSSLHAACNSEDANEDVVHALVASRADVNVAAYPRTKLLKRVAWLSRKMCKRGEADSPKVVMAMLSGARPLHWAAKRCNFGLCEALLQARADPSCRNTFGLTAMDLATWSLHEAPQTVIGMLGEEDHE